MKGTIMPDKTIPSPDAAPIPAAKKPSSPVARKPGFDPASLKGGKLHGGKGPAPGGKRMGLPGKARGR